jgi:1-acyl-sn-glycerol-3-phosphate acyltransferase
MGALLAILCFFFSTIAWDITSKMYFLFSRKHYEEFWNKFFKMMSHKSVFFAHVYAGLKLEITSDLHTPLPDRFIIISNHQSLADIVTIVEAFPDHDLKYTAKKELKYGIPAVSVGLRRGQHAFLERSGGFQRTYNQLKRLAANKGKYDCPVIFAEGSRSRTGELKKFHSAGLRMLLEHSNLPVLGVAVDGGYKIATAKDLFSKLKGLVYRVKALKLYPHVNGKKEIQGVLDSIHNDIELQLKKWRTEEEQ